LNRQWVRDEGHRNRTIVPELEQRFKIWLASKASLTASVCPGAFQLAKAGLLRKKTITKHWSDVAAFRTMLPDLPVQENTRRVDAGEIVTSAGSSAGHDMSLHLVARLESEELAVRTARQMDYAWQR
jgi:transcriptional regulator GlxA family with amidase domain